MTNAATAAAAAAAAAAAYNLEGGRRHQDHVLLSMCARVSMYHRLCSDNPKC
jgi:hypothetical protein